MMLPITWETKNNTSKKNLRKFLFAEVFLNLHPINRGLRLVHLCLFLVLAEADAWVEFFFAESS